MTNDPNRLRSDGSDFERQLLDAAGSEAPPPELVLGMRQALGLTSLSVPPAAALAAKSSVGWVSAGVAVVVLGAGAALFQYSRSPAPPLTPRPALAAPTVEAAPAPLANPAPAQPSEAPVAAAEKAAGPGPRTAAVETAAPSAARSKSQAASPSDTKRDLREEIELIDAARGAVARRAPEAALESLRRYFTNYPRGAFTPEAQVLRIEALEQSGRHAQASSLASAFLSRHPDSPLAERVARSVGRE